MPLRVLGGPLPTRKVRKLGAWTRPGNAWNGGESVGLIGGLIGGGGGLGRRRPAGAGPAGPRGVALRHPAVCGGKPIAPPPPVWARGGPHEPGRAAELQQAAAT